LLAYPAAFVAGLLISLTPCVYPVIPIQLAFISSQTVSALHSGKSISSRGFTLSALFVIGMATIYAALGAFASLTGALFGSWAASPWTYVVVGNVVLLMALSMLDVFHFSEPQFLTRWNPRPKNKGYLSALLIGASSALVVGPCTSPALGSLLSSSERKVTLYSGRCCSSHPRLEWVA
jgi:thiol:disulfide interchange protein DsbD